MGGGDSYALPSAEMIGRRAGRAAGRRLPMTPMAAANARPYARSDGVTRNANETSPRLAEVLAVMPFIRSERRQPRRPPAIASSSPSSMNDINTEKREN